MTSALWLPRRAFIAWPGCTRLFVLSNCLACFLRWPCPIWPNRWWRCWWPWRWWWWYSVWSLRHVAFYVQRWFWHPDLLWVVLIMAWNKTLQFHVAGVRTTSRQKSRLHELWSMWKRESGSIDPVFSEPGASCASQLSPVVCSHTGLSRHARLIQHGRTAWAEGHTPSGPSSVGAKWLHQSSQTPLL